MAFGGLVKKVLKLAMPDPIPGRGRIGALKPVEKAMGNLTRAAAGGEKGMKIGAKTHGPAGRRLNDVLRDL